MPDAGSISVDYLYMHTQKLAWAQSTATYKTRAVRH